MTIEEMKKEFAEHPEREELIRRQLAYYFPLWLQEKHKEKMIEQIPETDKRFLLQCILLMNITGQDLEALRESEAYREAERLLAAVAEGDGAAPARLKKLYDANWAREKAAYEKQLAELKYRGLPADKRSQVDALRAQGKEAVAARIFAEYKKYGKSVKEAEESCALFETLAGIFDVRLFTAEALRMNQEHLPRICAAVASPRLLMPLSCPEKLYEDGDALPGNWYLHRRLTVAEYRTLVANISVQGSWNGLFQDTVDRILGKTALPLPSITERKNLIWGVIDDFQNKRYGSAMIVLFSLIEGLLWALAVEVGKEELLFVEGSVKGLVYDCKKRKSFQARGIRDILERTAVNRYLDPAFIEEFCGELYEERNPVLHGNQICGDGSCAQLGMCFLKKLFVLDYVMETLESVQRKRIFAGIDALDRQKGGAMLRAFEKSMKP